MGHYTCVDECSFRTDFESQEELDNAIKGWLLFEAPKKHDAKHIQYLFLDWNKPKSIENMLYRFTYMKPTLHNIVSMEADEPYAKHTDAGINMVIALIQRLMRPDARAALLIQDSDGDGMYYGYAIMPDDVFPIESRLFVVTGKGITGSITLEEWEEDDDDD